MRSQGPSRQGDRHIASSSGEVENADCCASIRPCQALNLWPKNRVASTQPVDSSQALQSGEMLGLTKSLLIHQLRLPSPPR
jgi:hypothetical protein